MLIFRCFLLVPLKNNEKAAKSLPERSLFGGGRHGSSIVNSSKKLVFRVFEQAPFLCHFYLHFGLHFGDILGAKFATILLLGRPGRQQGPPSSFFFVGLFFMDFKVRQGGGKRASSMAEPRHGGMVKPHFGSETGLKPTRQHIFQISVFRPCIKE